MIALLSYFALSSLFAADSLICPDTSSRPFTEIQQTADGVAQALNSQAMDAASSCFDDLTAKDKNTIRTINQEMEKDQPLHENTAKIISDNEGKLSRAGKLAVIAAQYKSVLENIALTFKDNPKLQAASQDLDRDLKIYDDNRAGEHFWGWIKPGLFWGTPSNDRQRIEDDKKLVASTHAFLWEVDRSTLSPELKKSLKKNINATLLNSQRQASGAALSADTKLGVTQVGVGTVTAAGLIAASVLTLGATKELAIAATAYTGYAAMGLMTGAVSGAVGGAAGGAGFMAGISITKMIGHAGVDYFSGHQAFYCSMADDVYKNGDEAVHQALVGAAMGGAIGGELGLLAPLPAVAAVAGTGTAVAFTGVGVYGTLVVGSEAYNLCVEADKEKNPERARELKNRCHKLIVDAGVDGVATIAGAGGIYHGAKAIAGGGAKAKQNEIDDQRGENL